MVSRKIGILLSSLMVVMLLGGCSSANKGIQPTNSVNPEETQVQPTQPIEPSNTEKGKSEDKGDKGDYTYTNNIDKYDYKTDELLYDSEGKLTLSLDNLIDKWDKFINSGNLYIQAYTSEEDYSILLRNLSGETLVSYSDNGVAVYLKDNTMIYIKDGMYTGKDLTLIDLLGYSVKAIEDGYANVQAVDLSSESGELVYEYAVDIIGYDNIHKLYSNLDTDYADTMIEQFKENNTDTDEDGNKVLSQLNMRFVFLGGEKGITSAGCYIYNGDKMIGIQDEDWAQCSSLWTFDGYYTVYDWNASDEFYSLDYSDSSEENGDKVYGLTKGLLEELQVLVSDYFEKYGNTNPIS